MDNSFTVRSLRKKHFDLTNKENYWFKFRLFTKNIVIFNIIGIKYSNFTKK